MHFLKTLACVLCFGCISLFACQAKKIQKDDARSTRDPDPRCAMKHDPGPCRGAFTRYYFDKVENTCKSFIYGGCQGVVPFETLEECQAACGR